MAKHLGIDYDERTEEFYVAEFDDEHGETGFEEFVKVTYLRVATPEEVAQYFKKKKEN